MRVLLVEDDESIAGPLVEGLARYGIIADPVATGAEAFAAGPRDMLLLDPALSDRAGIEVCRRLHRHRSIPLILLCARDDEADRALGQELRADDYLAQPFAVRELVARMRAVERRARPVPARAPVGPAPADNPVRTYGPLAIDTRSRRIRVHGVPVPLAPKEFDLLVLLAAEPGAVVDRRHILETVWEADVFGQGKTLDFHVASLRRKLGGAGWIQNRRGVGFRLVVPV